MSQTDLTELQALQDLLLERHTACRNGQLSGRRATKPSLQQALALSRLLGRKCLHFQEREPFQTCTANKNELSTLQDWVQTNMWKHC